MLNYIWLALVVIGILVAVGNDWHDISTDKYHNDEQDLVSFAFFPQTPDSLKAGLHYPCKISYKHGEIFPSSGLIGMVHRLELVPRGYAGFQPQRSDLIPTDRNNGVVHIFIDTDAHPMLKERFRSHNNPEFLLGYIHWDSLNTKSTSNALIRYEPIKFNNLKSVTNYGIIQSAKTAVELAIGLIGIMALWLGVMKIAEQSGLVAKLARLLKPVTTRLFPDVPPDHPAMGAMIMNISANMLGLANAATPLGLKAMEELNTLNKKLGTATDAMCTFLVINTSNVQLIPATVIAIRASAGSSNPAEILGSTLVATFVALVVGITTAKLLARLPFYKKQLQAEG